MAREGWIRVGESRVEKRDLDALSRAWCDGRLVLCLGAGVSQPYGLPNWNDLVTELLLEATGKFVGFLRQYRRPLAEWLADEADLSLPMLARIIEHALWRNDRDYTTAKFLEDVRKQLYRNYEEPNEDTSLRAVARLVERGMARETRGVPMVATFNFDDLLEEELERLQVECDAVYAGDSDPPVRGVPVLHLNGYLPRAREVPENRLVFTEEAYHQISSLPYHWSGAELIRLLRRYTVLFVGLSMTDPNLRRFLDIAKQSQTPRGSEAPDEPRLKHFVLRASYTEPGAGAIQSLQRMASEEAKRLGTTRLKTEEQALDALRFVLQRAKAWDEWLFEELLVRPVWIEDHRDIPALLDKIGS